MQCKDTDLAAEVHDGAMIALPAEQSYVSMDMVRALVLRGVKDLHILCVPVGGLAADILIGAGCVKTIECAAVTLGEHGFAPRFCSAVENGEIEIKESTCPAIHTALQASEKGVPFMPLSGLIGSDILKSRSDWKVVDDPLEKGNGPIVLLPAIRPDFAVFHAPLADKYGDAWVGRRRELITMSHASKSALITVEEFTDKKLIDDHVMVPGIVPNLYVGGIAEAYMGAKPLGMPGFYEPDNETYARYAKMAQTKDGFEGFLDEFLAASDRKIAV